MKDEIHLLFGKIQVLTLYYMYVLISVRNRYISGTTNNEWCKISGLKQRSGPKKKDKRLNELGLF